MALLHCLHTVRTFRNTQREGSLVVSNNRLLVGIDHQHTIAAELYARHRYGRTFVIDVAAIYIIGINGKYEVVTQVHFIVEADRLRLEAARIAHRGHTDAIAARLLINQSAEFEETCRVRHSSGYSGTHNVAYRLSSHGKAT